MTRHFYSALITDFLKSSAAEILGALSQNSGFADEVAQKEAWLQQIDILKTFLKEYQGTIFFEYSIPRMGRRIDVLLVIENVIFVLEFKIGESNFLTSAVDQVFDYALDLKNFHETSHKHLIAPILIATRASDVIYFIETTSHNDHILFPVKTNSSNLKELLNNILLFADGEIIDCEIWSKGRYQPTPTIIEAAMALYSNHSVAEISRSDASAINLTETSNAVSQVIDDSKLNNTKAIQMQYVL
jgi:hypothetical protein